MQRKQMQEIKRALMFMRPGMLTGNNLSSQHGSNSVNNEVLRVIDSQSILIMQLLQHQTSLAQEFNRRQNSTEYGSENPDLLNIPLRVTGYRELNVLENYNSGSPLLSGSQPEKHQIEIIQSQNNQEIIQKHLYKVVTQNTIDRFVFQFNEDNISINEQNISNSKKQTQTKNMVKNFGKAIFRFIRKNKDKRDQVLLSLGVNPQEFMKMFENLKGKVHSISELRSLWTEEGNKFSKAFRILSNIYLRQYCLQRTFNSRVENHSIHLKYRQKLMSGVKNPEEFTALKTN